MQKRPRVLVVDDEPVIRRIHARYLTRLGFEVEAVDDGDQCLAAVRAAATGAGDSVTSAASAAVPSDSQLHGRHSGSSRPFSAVLMDIVMRRVHGDQACADLRAAGFTLPVIATTGNARPRDVERLLGLGLGAVLEKPFSIAQSAAVLHSCGVDASEELVREE